MRRNKKHKRMEGSLVEAFQKSLREVGIRQDELAAHLGMSKSYFSERLRDSERHVEFFQECCRALGLELRLESVHGEEDEREEMEREGQSNVVRLPAM